MSYWLKLTHVVVYLTGNPYGGPDKVTYGWKSTAVRAARTERKKGLRVEVREIKRWGTRGPILGPPLQF
jgi:hypothetical protein